jgi:methylglutaconyl-CoA hydratase
MLKMETADGIGILTLDRPALHNAFNDELIAKITKAIEEFGASPSVRVIVLRANGPSFSAGGDLNWMKRAATYTAEENLRDARAGANMFLAVSRCPKAVIARVHGRALGGGSGLVACCDMAVAVESAEFGFPEVKLGLIPGIISPFLISRIGVANAREYFLTGERFSAMRAKEIGLLQRVVADESAMDAVIERWIAELRTSSPAAVAAAKKLISDVGNRPAESVMDIAAAAIADARVSAEGRAGVEAFLSRTRAPWLPR